MIRRWQSELNTLRREADARDAPILPDAICRWFDFNRSFNRSFPDRALDEASVMESIRQDVVALSGFDLGDWRLHTDAYGWRLSMQRYTRDGAAHYLLRVTRESQPSARDALRLDKMIRHLGADPDADYLLSARGEDDPDVMDFWTWRVP